jgi:hypothetical protein
MKNINTEIGILQRYKKEIPFSITLNRFIEYQFNKLPFKVQFVDFEPYKDFNDMVTQFETSHILKVSTLHCENTIFGNPLINQKFRAFHDFIHICENLDFNYESELLVNYSQNLIGLKYGLNRWDLQLLNIETAGQILYFRENNFFPENQRSFAIQELKKSFNY